ncbi:MAG: choice-of-anchor D domain-containing protein [Myxococcota bacterium]
MRFISLAGLAVVAGCSEFEITDREDIVDVSPNIKVEPLDIYFGILDLGETQLETVTISNIGDAALEVAAVVLETETEGSTNPFSFIGADGGASVESPFPLTLTPEATFSVDILYTAVTPADQGKATVISNDPQEGAVEVTLSGGFTGPQLEINPPNYDFEDRMLDCGDTKVFELRNVGTETLVIDDVFMEKDNFTIVEMPTNYELEPGQLTLVEVAFTPAVAQLYTDNLTVLSNDPDNDGIELAALFGAGDDDGICQALDLTFKVEYEIADIAAIVDGTCSMGGTISGLQTDFQAIAESLFNEIEDITFGVAEFRDYNYSNMGGGSDLPFELLTQQTTELQRVQNAFNSMSASGGSDGPESSHEALFQALTGQGYDQNCDGNYDDADDVVPFKRRPEDAFGGTVTGSQSGAVEGSGQEGGMGFRKDVLPVVIFATDNYLRDPGNGYQAPGGCTTVDIEDSDATSSMVKEAAADLNAKIIGVGVGYTVGDARYKQMDSVSDLVTTWNNGSDDFEDTIVGAVLELIGDETFDVVELEVSQDVYNLVDSVTPDRWTDVPSGTDVTFTITTVEEAAIVLEPNENTTDIIVDVYGSIGARTWLLNSHTFYALIPEEYRDEE